MKHRGSVCSQINPYGMLVAAGQESWCVEANCFAKAIKGDFPIPLIRSVLSSTMWNMGSAQRLIANKYHPAITSWCSPPHQGKNKALSSQGSAMEITALTSSPCLFRGPRKAGGVSQTPTDCLANMFSNVSFRNCLYCPSLSVICSGCV